MKRSGRGYDTTMDFRRTRGAHDGDRCVRNAPRLRRGRAAERVAVTVKNANWMDMDVFAVRGGTRARVGSVTGLTTATFRVPPTSHPTASCSSWWTPSGATPRT
jgi:hypothetical protein